MSLHHLVVKCLKVLKSTNLQKWVFLFFVFCFFVLHAHTTRETQRVHEMRNRCCVFKDCEDTHRKEEKRKKKKRKKKTRQNNDRQECKQQKNKIVNFYKQLQLLAFLGGVRKANKSPIERQTTLILLSKKCVRILNQRQYFQVLLIVLLGRAQMLCSHLAVFAVRVSATSLELSPKKK